MAKRIIVFGIAALALAGLIGVVVRGGAGLSGGGSSDVGASTGDMIGGAQGGSAGGGGGAGGAETFRVGAMAPASEGGQPELHLTEPRIVKTASLSLRVADGSFADRFREASLIVTRHGGFVSSSRTSGAATRSGTLLLRVPNARFEDALGDLRRLGRITGDRVSGEDVTAQFVDLEARLRNWEAQEGVLLRLMRKATTIDASIKVQRQLQDVQLAIEQIRGQLRVIADQVQMSEISVAMKEAGVVAKVSQGALAEAWRQAARGFVAVIAAVIVGLGYVIPLALMALVLAAGWILIRKARPRVA